MPEVNATRVPVPYPRATCSQCGRQDVILRKDGSLRGHRAPEGWRCDGSYLPPAGAKYPCRCWCHEGAK